jgi:hypothetical protein
MKTSDYWIEAIDFILASPDLRDSQRPFLLSLRRCAEQYELTEKQLEKLRNMHAHFRRLAFERIIEGADDPWKEFLS